MLNLAIVYRDPSTLKARDRNPRIHSTGQIEQIAQSIGRLGFLNPILVTKESVIIAGHARNEAAKLNRLPQVPTVQIDHLTPEQIRAYVIAENKLSELGGWNNEILSLELKELAVEFNFDLSFTGFEIPEIDVLLNLNHEEDERDHEEIGEVDRTRPAITQPGDSWDIGNHRILCADTSRAESFAALLGDKRAQMVFTDPPYNVPVNGHVSGLGRVKHREFAQASGEMSPPEFTVFLRNAFRNLTQFSASGSIHYVFTDWRHVWEALDAARGIYSDLKNICVWAKTNAGMGSLYRSQTEFVLVFKSGSAKHTNNIELGRHGRHRSNLWTYPGMNTFGKNRDADLRLHPTVKPIALVADAILDCSEPGDLILDPFAGSGTTLLAAERVGRKGYGIEIDPHYVDAIVMRFQRIFHCPAVHSVGGDTFDARKEQEPEKGNQRGN